MDEDRVFAAELLAHLADCFKKRQRLDVADCSADLDDGDIGRPCAVHSAGDLAHRVLDLVGDVRDDLDSFAEVVAAALLGDDLLVDSAGGQVVIARQLGVGKALVMAQVEIGFRPIIGHKYFAVLEGAHGAGVDVEVRVELHQVDPHAARLKQAADGGRGEAFAQGRNNAAGHEDVLCRHETPPSFVLSTRSAVCCLCTRGNAGGYDLVSQTPPDSGRREGAELGMGERGFGWEQTRAVGALAGAAVLIVCMGLLFSTTRHWPLVNDPALMHYVIFLMERGLAPYREISDYNLPGAYVPEWISMRLAAGLHLSEPAMWRVMDAMVELLALLAMVALAGRRRWFAGVFAGSLFALYHGRDGMEHAGQRDLWLTTLLLWALWALFAAMRSARTVVAARYAGLFGLLVGAACTIKPLGAAWLVLLPPLLVSRARDRGRVLAWAAAGFLLPALGVLLFLLHWHAVEALLEVLRIMLPYHAGLHDGPLLQLLRQSNLPSVAKLLCFLLPLFALERQWRGSLQRALQGELTAQWYGGGERVLLLLCVALGLCVFLSQGKGYPYHKYPYIAFLFLLAGLEFTAAARSPRIVLRTLGAGGLLFGVCLCAPTYLRGAAHSHSATPAVPAMEQALRAAAGAGGIASLDRQVQCIDTVSGCTDTLLALGLEQATGTLYDEALFPQMPSGWVMLRTAPPLGQKLPEAVVVSRQRFQAQLAAHGAPRVMLVSSALFPEGPDGYQKLALWPWFDAYLRQQYTLVSQQEFGVLEPGYLGFRVYVRRPETDGASHSGSISVCATS